MAQLATPPPNEQVLNVVRQMMKGSSGAWGDQADFEKGVRVARMISEAKMPTKGIAPEIMKQLGYLNPQAGSGAGSALAQAMEEMRKGLSGLGVDVAKEIDFNTFTNAIPSTLGFNVFDLSGPARITAPYMAPIRGKIPRVDGMGPAALEKVIRGFSGTMTGGATSVNPAFPLEVPLAGSNVEAARGNPVAYVTGDVIVPFKFFALRDDVTFTAFFSGSGFQDLRAMSAALLMQMAMMGEERAILMGRDTVLATPGQATGTERAVAGGETGILGTGTGGTNVYVKVTAIGPFGETAAGVVSSAENIAEGTTSVVDYTWSDVVGALGYNVYVALQDAGATAPTVYYQDYIVGAVQSTGFNKFTVGAFGRRTSGNTAPTTDTGTGGSDNYRGIIQTVEEGPASGTSILGTSGRLNAAQTGTQLTWLQDMFATMWQNAKADPEEIWMNSREIKNASDLIQQGSSNSAYRIAFSPGEANGVIAGVAVSAIINESTRREVKLSVHPWLPFGNAVICSYALPFATAFGRTTTMEIKGPQDYMQIMWPLTTLRWESSIIWMNALVIAAPTFFGIKHGIAQSAATSFIC